MDVESKFTGGFKVILLVNLHHANVGRSELSTKEVPVPIRMAESGLTARDVDHDRDIGEVLLNTHLSRLGEGGLDSYGRSFGYDRSCRHISDRETGDDSGKTKGRKLKDKS
jgi:hypothetical protein